MQRRTFLGQGLAAGLLGVPGENVILAAAEAKPVPALAFPGALSYSAQEQRHRLENLAFCQRAIRRCRHTRLVTNYLPGQVVYNLGEYPCRKPYDPDDWDERELDRLRDQGIRLVQVHEEWSDSQRLFGGHKFAPLNPAGFRRFINMVHARGLKLIVYASSGFFQRTDPDFRPEWARAGQDLVEIYFHYARCSPASPSWRAYLLGHLRRLLDDYGVDGLYNDLGYIRLFNNPRPVTKDEVLPFVERADHDAALEDLLAVIYAEVKRRGGLVKVHASGSGRPHTRLPVYDYLWAGEGVRDIDGFREAIKDHPPYVVPCLDMSRAKIEREDELYLNAIPYLQFPLLLAGRPFTGERAVIPGIKYQPEERCFWTRHCRAIWRHHQAQPAGPHSYGWWDSVPGREEARPTHARWLRQYLPLVEEGSWAHLEVAEADLWRGPLPAGVVVSVFANRELYLVLANFNRQPASLTTTADYTAATDPNRPGQRQWTLGPRSLLILKRGAEQP